MTGFLTGLLRPPDRVRGPRNDGGGLEEADFVEGEEAEGGGADDAAEGDGAEAISGVEGVLAFAVVAGDEKLARGDDERQNKSISFPNTDFVAGVLFGTVVVGFAGVVVGMECGRFVAWVGPDCEDTVFDGDAFAGKGDDAFDNILVANTGDGLAG